MYLFLTELNFYNREEKPVLVNMNNVTHISEQLLPAKSYGHGEQFPALRATCISFTAGMREEVDAIYVLESLDKIYGAL